MMYFICDDVNKEEFGKLRDLKDKIPALKINCFVMGKDAGEYLKEPWVEVGVHGWDHTYPPECERDDQEEFIARGLAALRPYLPRLAYGFRAPGFQMIASTWTMLHKLGFAFIAHQTRIQPLFGHEFKQRRIINVHAYDPFTTLLERAKLYDSFEFLSSGIG